MKKQGLMDYEDDMATKVKKEKPMNLKDMMATCNKDLVESSGFIVPTNATQFASSSRHSCPAHS